MKKLLCTLLNYMIRINRLILIYLNAKKITLYEIMISLGNYIVRNQNKFTINQKCKAITKTVAEVSLFIHIECFEKTK